MESSLQLAEYVLTVSLAFTALALICDLVVVTSKRGVVAVVKQPALVGAPGGEAGEAGAEAAAPYPQAPPSRPKLAGLALYATVFTVLAFILVGVYLGLRIALTGHGPFANQHEFAVSFVFGILGAYLIVEKLYRVRALSLAVLPIAAALLVYAMSLDSGVEPLVPALQNNLLLTLHVGFAIGAYGAACVSCGAAIAYLAYPKLKWRFLPKREVFDEIGYKSATVTFPLLTVMIVLGAVWADTAWGRYWGWDPKETAALVTWLIYGAYLHARVTRGWQGKRSAWLLLLGFVAVLFAYFGNHFFGGLHSYA